MPGDPGRGCRPGTRRAPLDAGAAEGVLEGGLDPEDVLLRLGALWRIAPAWGERSVRRASSARSSTVSGGRVPDRRSDGSGGEAPMSDPAIAVVIIQ
ncbi:hypothetical protein CW362_02030 [Streptomyces populi]|uniref:Uncharacterized protein n=1 Tax=Streptomyces populi TaxID=2058924 RepID=A0A2I0SXZ7_9ACTN|nr:hypothetical protein CW362_02030 [Streptomyces populi]